ncbi:MAG TPA: PAS domain S-box protein, partial [Coleofasciculaceae cyanobacterium]
MNKQISQAAIAFVFLISGLALLSCLVTIASLQSNVLNGSLAMPPNPVLWVLISGMALRLIETEYKSDRQRVEADLRHTQADLEQRVLERTAELNQLTERLQQELQDRQSIEQALQASEELFRTLIRDLNVGVVIQSAQTEILLSNPKALELLSLTEDQLLGKTSFDPDWQVIREDGSVFPSALHPVPQAIATRSAVRNVVMGICSPKSSDQSVLEAGEPIWLLVNAEPQFTPVGEIRQVICTFSDITERKRILEKLRSRAQLERDLHGVVQ